jgi:hypothetical protein
VFEVRPRDLASVAAVVKECMEGAVVLNVPLNVKLSAGPSWGSLAALAPPGGPVRSQPPATSQPAAAAVCRPATGAVNLPPSQAQHHRPHLPGAGGIDLLAGAGRAHLPPPVARELFGGD